MNKQQDTLSVRGMKATRRNVVVMTAVVSRRECRRMVLIIDESIF
jgi:hypothetical protein